MNKIEKTETLSKILANRKFSVDVFQREYRWGQKQIEQIIMAPGNRTRGDKGMVNMV